MFLSGGTNSHGGLFLRLAIRLELSSSVCRASVP